MQHRIQFRLLNTFFRSAAFARINQFGIRRREPEQFGTYKVVVNNDVGAPKNIGAANRDQVGRAGPGTNQEDASAHTLRTIFFPLSL